MQNAAVDAVIWDVSVKGGLADQGQKQRRRAHWMYRCARWHVEWRLNGRHNEGHVNSILHYKYYITAGLTVALGVATQIDSVLSLGIIGSTAMLLITGMPFE